MQSSMATRDTHLGSSNGRMNARTSVEVYWPSVEQWFERIGKCTLSAGRRHPHPNDASSSEPLPAGATQPGNKAEFSEVALGGWFILRVATLPKERPAPNESQDLAAALAYFDKVPRDVFRKIRREKVPAHWQKPGRGADNSVAISDIGGISAKALGKASRNQIVRGGSRRHPRHLRGI